MKNFFSFDDVKDINALLETALEIKKNPFSRQEVGKNKTIGLLFFNPSLRTRLSSVKAAYNLGANVWVLNAGGDSWTLEMGDGTIMDGNTQEHINEAIRVMNTYCDVFGVRTFPNLKDRDYDYQEVFFKKIMSLATKPVVSLESATLHPLQSFADLITIAEHKPPKEKTKVVLTWAPHPRVLPQCVSNSFAQWFTKVDWIDLTIAQPKGYELSPEFTKGATLEYDQNKALEGADFVYAKNWSSFQNYGQKLDVSENWTIDSAKMSLTNQGKFMHCLPVRRNVVVTDDVIDSAASLVIQQAENRVYSAQTIFHELLK
ncbi:MAG: acetylornithine carbamoyltransferase [Flavobacteriaceae bacterium]|nr:MAG: acetylornithine carbamoyltransferase [Flavobacteriaceae bacterium]